MRRYVLAILFVGLMVVSSVMAQRDRDNDRKRDRGRNDERERREQRDSERDQHVDQKMREQMQGMMVRKRALELEERALEIDAARRELDLNTREREIELNAMAREQELEAREREQGLRHKDIEMEAKRKKKASPKGHHGRGHGKKDCGAFLLFCGIVHLLFAIWVFQDIRKRNTGSGIWVVATLLVGFFALVPYTISRLGDKQEG